nr:glycosyltransferase family 4 protein [Mucilaginibacter sp. L294]
MKILLIMDPGIAVPPVYYGGIERVIYLLAEEYHALGHQVTLLAGPGSYCSGKTISFGSNTTKHSKIAAYNNILFVWSYLRKNRKNFDLIHNFGRLIYLLPVINQKAYKIMSYQRPVTARGIKIINRLPNRNLLFTACSNYCVSTGNVAGKWHTVYNCIDFDLYHLNNAIKNSDPLIFLGRLDRIKGAHTAIAVAKATNSQLIIAGNIPDTDDNYQYFKNELEPLFDGKQIVYVGALDDVNKNEYLGKAKALLFPIEWDEPFGIVMIEAMACGTPVIAFNRGSVPEVVNEGITGFITTDVRQMIYAVNNLGIISRQACRQQAMQRFNIKKTAQEYLSLTGQ